MVPGERTGIFTVAEVLQISLKANRLKTLLTYSVEIKIKIYLYNKSTVFKIHANPF